MKVVYPIPAMAVLSLMGCSDNPRSFLRAVSSARVYSITGESESPRIPMHTVKSDATYDARGTYADQGNGLQGISSRITFRNTTL